MKKTLLGIALALAIMPLTFASPNSTTTTKAKTHGKKSHKKPMKKAAVKPASVGM